MKRLTLLTSAVVVLAGVTACGGGVTGQPQAGPTSTVTQDPSGNDPGSSTTSPATSGNLAGANACSLLTASEATGAGLPSAGYTEKAGAKSGCEWDGTTYTVIVSIRTDVGLSGVLANGGSVADTQIGSHQAKQVTESAGGCLYSIGVSDSSRVDVDAEGNGQSACPEALAVAQLVEKHLS